MQTDALIARVRLRCHFRHGEVVKAEYLFQFLKLPPTRRVPVVRWRSEFGVRLNSTGGMIRYIEYRGEAWKFGGVHHLVIRPRDESTAYHTPPRYVSPKKDPNTEANLERIYGLACFQINATVTSVPVRRPDFL